ncbi:hypothetical protein [Parvularcula sp. IMCC14364]|uniref:hypothetical protein n=1 Tax=Parvularcula sp. IMCC14364 TaxID=3067902 RepID=UPI00274131CF|nr:hypothetical protein [Parvularcula sp. IMCC14364]
MPNLTLIRAMRIIACGADRARGFARPMPAGCSLSKLQSFLEAINQHARRPLLLSPPCATRISPDEKALIGLIWASQNERQSEFLARASWLVRWPGQTAVQSRCDDLAAALEVEGIFPDCLPASAPPTRQPALPVLHPVDQARPAIAPQPAAMI